MREGRKEGGTGENARSLARSLVRSFAPTPERLSPKTKPTPPNPTQPHPTQLNLTAPQFTPTRTIPNLPEPFNGCQGSIVSLNGTLYLSHPNPQKNSGLAPSIVSLLGANVNLTGRDHMTVWSSSDDGTTYEVSSLVDEGASGYSSLQVDGDGLWILYEQSDPAPVTLSSLSAEALIGGLAVLNPDRFVLRRVLV